MKDLKTHAAYMRKWRKKNGRKWKAYMKKWRSVNQGRIKSTRRRYYRKNRTIELASVKAWQKTNPLRRKAIKAAFIARRYPGRIDANLVLFIFKRDKRTCHWCGKKNLRGRQLTLEHLKPRNSKRTLTVACLSCNTRRLHRL